MEPGMTYQELLEELECPVCYTYVGPPIRQCINMHVLCEDCFEKVDVCPVCRQEKTAERNHVLERLYKLMKIPCQHEECTFVAKGREIKDHESKCPHRSSTCPLHISHRCKWTGPMSKMEDHCRKEHSDSLIVGPRACLVTPMISDTLMFYAFKYIFRIYWDIDANTGDFMISVTYQGNPEEINRFSYNIAFISTGRPRIRRSMNGKCGNVDYRMSLNTPESVLWINYDFVQKFCNKQGDLEFSLRIIDNWERLNPSPGSCKKRKISDEE